MDYVSTAGVKAFDELEKVVDKLGDDYGKGFTWAKLQKEKLQLAIRYLKDDYKVRVFCECISIFTIENMTHILLLLKSMKPEGAFHSAETYGIY